MEKEFEALEDFNELEEILSNQKLKYKGIVNFNLDTIEQALLELKAIKEANSGEAIECLEVINNYGCGFNNNMKFSEVFEKEYNSIKHYILKAQEQEKVLEIIKEKRVDLDLLKQCKTFKEYNCMRALSRELDLNKEEFDLLKRC